MINESIYGGIEAGGTKFVCATGSGNGEIISETIIDTTNPQQTVAQIIDFFSSQGKLKAVGIGSFGPVDVNKKSPTYGKILNTPKQGWQGINLKKQIEEALNIPVNLETDVDAAAIGERYHGRASYLNSFIYVTIGTGIGGSIFINGNLLHGMSHSEMGHMQIPTTENSQHIVNTCSLHKNCFEGFASGAAMEKLYSKKAELIDDPKAWEIEAEFIALGLANMAMLLPVELIIIGGSVIKHDGLLADIRTKFNGAINGYIELPPAEDYIVTSSSDTIGVVGSIKLATLL